MGLERALDPSGVRLYVRSWISTIRRLLGDDRSIKASATPQGLEIVDHRRLDFELSSSAQVTHVRRTLRYVILAFDLRLISSISLARLSHVEIDNFVLRSGNARYSISASSRASRHSLELLLLTIRDLCPWSLPPDTGFLTAGLCLLISAASTGVMLIPPSPPPEASFGNDVGVCVIAPSCPERRDSMGMGMDSNLSRQRKDREGSARIYPLTSPSRF